MAATTREKLNVLMVTAFDIDQQAGGVNTMIRTLNRQLSANCRVVMLELDWNARRPVRRIVNGDTRYRLRLQAPFSSSDRLRSLASWLRSFLPSLHSLISIVRDESIDIVHLHYGAAYQYYFPLLRRLVGVRYLLTLHGSDVMTFERQPTFRRRLLRLTIRGADHVVPVSNSLASQSVRVLGDLPRLSVIHNGLDFAGLDSLYDPTFNSSVLDIMPSEYFLMVSNVTHCKAQDVAIRAWQYVRPKYPDLQLLIVGEKRDLWDECVRLIEETDCNNAVRLLGAQSRGIAINLMHRARALIVPSRFEGLGYVVLEAASIGIPIICSDIKPFREIVGHRDLAFVTPVEDHRAIADAVDKVMTDSEAARRKGAALRCIVRRKFSASEMAERYLEIYRRLGSE